MVAVGVSFCLILSTKVTFIAMLPSLSHTESQRQDPGKPLGVLTRPPENPFDDDDVVHRGQNMITITASTAIVMDTVTAGEQGGR